MAVSLLEAARRRWVYLLWLVVTIAFGLATRMPNIEWPMFISEHAGDALWSVALYLGLAGLLPRAPSWSIFVATLGVSYGVELSQLLAWQWLEAVRETRIGQLFLGTGFQWLDFPRYTAGALFTYVVDRIYVEKGVGRVAPRT